MNDFKSEVAMMTQCRHPNICLLMGIITQPNLGIVSEFVPYGSLFQLLHGKQEVDVRRRAALDPKRRLNIALDIARGMAYLHTRNPAIVHRDLKSSNLLVAEGLRIKVCDFGLSRAMSNGLYISTVGAGGTPQWMSPECIKGDNNVDNKTDVYSFGCVLFEIVTQSIPWENMSPHQVMLAMIARRRLMMPEWAQPEIVQLTRDCWHEVPNERPSFEEIIERLKALEGITAAVNCK